MIVGNMGAKIVVTESYDVYNFQNDCDMIMQYSGTFGEYYKLDTSYADAHVYKAIFWLINPNIE